jgi:hypothetical protein
MSPFGQPGHLLSTSRSNPSLENFHFNIIGQQQPDLLKRISLPNPNSQYLDPTSPESEPAHSVITDHSSSTPSVAPAPQLAPLKMKFPHMDPRVSDVKNAKRSGHPARRDPEEIHVMGTPIIITSSPDTIASREINQNGAQQDPVAAKNMADAPLKPHDDPNNLPGGRQRLFMSSSPSPSRPDPSQHLTPPSNALRPHPVSSQPESRPSAANSSQQGDNARRDSFAPNTLKSSASSLFASAQRAYDLTQTAHATSSRFLVSFDAARAAFKEVMSVIETMRAAFDSAQVAFGRASDAWEAIEGSCQSGMHDFEDEFGKAHQALNMLGEVKDGLERSEAERSKLEEKHQRLAVEKEQKAAENIHRLRRELDETMTRTSQQVEAERTEKEAERLAKEKLESVIAQLVSDKKELLKRQGEEKERHRQEVEDLVAKLTAQTDQRERQEQVRVEAEGQSRIQASQGQNFGRGELESSQITQPTHFHGQPRLPEISTQVKFEQSPELQYPPYPISAAPDRNHGQSRREDVSNLQNEPFQHTQARTPSPPPPPNKPSQPPKRFKTHSAMQTSPVLTEAQIRHNIRHLITSPKLNSQIPLDQNPAPAAETKQSQPPENKLLKKHEIKQEKMTSPPPSGRNEAGPDPLRLKTFTSFNLPSANMDVDSNALPHALPRVSSQAERDRPLVGQVADSSTKSHHLPKTVENPVHGNPTITPATRTSSSRQPTSLSSGEAGWLSPGGNRPDPISPESRARIQLDHWSPPRRYSPPPLLPPRPLPRVDHYSPSPTGSPRPTNEWYPKDSRARWNRSNVSPPPTISRKRLREEDSWSLDAPGYPSRRNWSDDPRQRDRREIDSGPAISRYRDEVGPRRRTPPPLHHPPARSYDLWDPRPVTRTEPAATGIRAEPMANRPRAESITNGPRAESMANRPRAEAMTNGPRAEPMADGPRTEAVFNGQRTKPIVQGPCVEVFNGLRAERTVQPVPDGQRIQSNRTPPLHMQRQLNGPSEAYQDMRWRRPPTPDRSDSPGPAHYNTSHDEPVRFQPPHTNADMNANVSGTSKYGETSSHVPYSAGRSYSRTSPGIARQESQSETSTGETRAAVVVAPQGVVPVAQPVPEQVAHSDVMSVAPLASRIAPAHLQSVGDRVPLLDRLTDQATAGRGSPRGAVSRKPNNNPRGGTKLSLLDRLAN